MDVERVREWMEFFGNAETFENEPFRFIPHGELMRSQIKDVMQHLFLNQNDARDRLNTAASLTFGPHGRSILTAMVRDGEQPLKPAVAIAASLFVPHRQWVLPTCTIDSILISEIRNHPERLMPMYTQMLSDISDNQFAFPRECPVQRQQIVDSSITVNLRNGGFGRDRIFRDIFSADPAKAAKQTAKCIAWIQIPKERHINILGL